MKCEFSLNHYREIIELAKDKGYKILPIKKYVDSNGKTLLLRHDIDFSLEYAYELANFEYDLGICSSYYVLLHAETYNALSPTSMTMIETIHRMGHEIGLHYDSRYSLSHESDILSSIIRKAIYSYAQHFPTGTKQEEYQGLLDVKSLNKDYKYLSDSGRNWRELCVCHHLEKGKNKKLHICIHPEWWVTNSKTPEDMIHQLWLSLQNKTVRDIQEIKQMLYEYYRDILRKEIVI